eukprot:TRINITY_DN697_c0_g1_i3.p1 TRINITY_DN697_c0_g1~~TRINITY_DN697_c0_g1_i3.p1  ORF type:complete len:339 (-),score=30.36 TRINITY_DN697_c0_g1_i3:289-1305(-)
MALCASSPTPYSYGNGCSTGSSFSSSSVQCLVHSISCSLQQVGRTSTACVAYFPDQRKSCFFVGDAKLISCNTVQSLSRIQMNSENFSNNRHDAQQYVETYVVDAVRMVPSRNSLYMMMADGSEVEVAHVNPTAGRLLYQASTPTIFLRVAENSSLMLPIVVGDLAVALLMKAIREEHGARPNYYELMGNMLQALEHKVKLVKITQRVVDTYYAQIFIEKEGGESSQTLISIDARPSDAINLAVRCKVPIFVSRSIIMNDAVRLVTDRTSFDGRELLTHDVDITLDRPQTNLDIVSEEITLMMAMLSAAEEERYADAAKFRDDLASLRRKSRKHLNKH